MQKRIVADVFMSVVLITRQRRSAAVEYGIMHWRVRVR